MRIVVVGGSGSSHRRLSRAARATRIDLVNSQSFEPSAMMEFFTAHVKNLLAGS